MIVPLMFLSAIFYRLGGLGADGKKWFPFLPSWAFDTKVRDIGCPLVCLYWMVMNISAPFWQHGMAFLILFAMLTTYWDWLFGQDNFWIHGLACGLAYSAYGVTGGILVRSAVLCVTFGLLNLITRVVPFGDWIEELGRGGLLVLTLQLLLAF